MATVAETSALSKKSPFILPNACCTDLVPVRCIPGFTRPWRNPSLVILIPTSSKISTIIQRCCATSSAPRTK